jgi:hypothetical protein
MLREHMGLSEAEAEQWAGDMGEMMRAMHGDRADEMLEACAALGGPAAGNEDEGTYDPNRGSGGMMGGGSGGMMGGGGSGMMGGGSGMMGGGSGMMGF